METNINEITINGKIYVEKGSGITPVNLDGLEFCIVRTYSAGVFAGWFDRSKISKVGTVKNARRLYYWDGAATLSQMALEGVKKPKNCKFTMVADHDLTEIIEVLPCTEAAKKSIEGVEIWKM